MSRVKNEPKIKNALITAIREQLEHRAIWLYLLCDEAEKRGLDKKDFGSSRNQTLRLTQGAALVKKAAQKISQDSGKPYSQNQPSGYLK